MCTTDPMSVSTSLVPAYDNKRLIERKAVQEKEEVYLFTTLMKQLPPGKRASLLLVVDSVDGRGDIEHFIAFALRIKKICPEINLMGMIGVWGSNSQ